MKALRDVASAIEAFDKASGESRDPAAVLAAVMSSAVADGANVPRMIQAAARAGMTRREADDVARNLQDTMDLKPKAGQLESPPPKRDETPGEAAIRTQAPRPEAKPEHSVAGPKTEIFFSDQAQGLEKTAAILAPKSSDPGAPERRSSSIGHEAKLQFSFEQRDDLSSEIGVMLDQMEAKIAKLLTAAGATPKLKAIATAIGRTRDRVTMEKSSSGATYRMAAGVVAEIAKISADLMAAEINLGAEEDPDNIRRPRI